MNTVRLALAQVAWAGSREAMLDRMELAARDADAVGASLVAFPELCTSPYFCVDPAPRVEATAYEPIPNGPTVRRMSTLAKELGVVLVVPMAERRDVGRHHNSAAIIDADGTLAGTYRKRHLPLGPDSWEGAYFRPGEPGRSAFDTAVGRVGVAICWERRFLDTWHGLADDDAQITIVPTASTWKPTDRQATLVQPAVAFLNAMYVATVNRVGRDHDDGPAYTGGSYVADPSGEILGPPGSGREELIVRDLDLDCLEAARRVV